MVHQCEGYKAKDNKFYCLTCGYEINEMSEYVKSLCARELKKIRQEETKLKYPSLAFTFEDAMNILGYREAKR